MNNFIGSSFPSRYLTSVQKRLETENFASSLLKAFLKFGHKMSSQISFPRLACPLKWVLFPTLLLSSFPSPVYKPERRAAQKEIKKSCYWRRKAMNRENPGLYHKLGRTREKKKNRKQFSVGDLRWCSQKYGISSNHLETNYVERGKLTELKATLLGVEKARIMKSLISGQEYFRAMSERGSIRDLWIGKYKNPEYLISICWS